MSCGACLVAKFTASDTLGITDSGASISGAATHYMVVAGGGGGGSARCGGGGAGGVRSSFDTINGTKGQQLHLSPGPYTVTVGGGGTVGSPGPSQATPGVDSSFAGITSTGGGEGNVPGGSGGGTCETSSPSRRTGNAGNFVNIEGNSEV